METVGIIGAMDEEIFNLKGKMEVALSRNVAGLDFYVGRLNGKSIVLVRCGIGKVNAAICTQILIDHFGVDKIINIGVAGAIFKDLKIGDIVISSDAMQHDMDTSSLGDPIGTIPRMDESYFKADPELISLAQTTSSEIDTEHTSYVGRVVSGDQFISSVDAKKRLWSLFNGYCAEMEGGAIAHACYLNQIPFVIIRAISDNADGSADISFEKFTHLAAQNSSKLVEAMIAAM